MEDFYFNADLMECIDDFSKRILTHYGKENTKYKKLSDMVQKAINYQRENEIQRNSRELVKKQTFTLLIEEMKSEFQQIDNKKLAQQMTLIDFGHFQAIKPRECLNKNWLNEEEKYSLAPNICDMIDSLNKTFKWTQVTILLSSGVDKRGRLIKKFLKICRELKALNNFHSLSAVFGALRSTPIFKLKEAWKLVCNVYLYICRYIRIYQNSSQFENILLL